MVSESTARVLWPEGSSIGNRFRMQGRGPPQEFEVLGTVADTKQISLDSPVQNQVYLLNAKQPSTSSTSQSEPEPAHWPLQSRFERGLTLSIRISPSRTS